MIERMSEASITVTATARTSVPKGSPTRCATTSAWCTAAITALMRPTAHSVATRGPTPAITAATSTTLESAGTSQVQTGIGLEQPIGS